jgi:peroxin-2
MTTDSYVSRINQIDAEQLDDEIYKVLKNQTNEITKYFPLGKVVKWEPELDVLIKYLIWNYSLKIDSSTFGQRLLNLSYENLDKKKSILLLIFLTVPNYLQKRLINENFIVSRLSQNHVKHKCKYFIEHLDNMFHLLNFIWKLAFLHLGNQPRCIDKLLNIYSQSLNMNKPRLIGYSYMTRELLWHGLIEFFTVGIPMIEFIRIQKWWNNLWLSKKFLKDPVIHCKLEDTSVCSYCNQRPILPHWAGCTHIFCYYCLKAHFTLTDLYRCPTCDNELYSSNMKACINV